MRTIPASAIIATRNRARSFAKTLNSLLSQGLLPAEFIVVDASDDGATKSFLSEFEKRVSPVASVRWIATNVSGAAPQRNQGVTLSTQPFIWFFDDDILFEPNCVSRLWQAIESDATLGGGNAMITNQRYHSPGFVSRTMFTLMHGRREKSFAGKVIGPAINLLPEDREDLPEIVPVDWLNLGCTMYRREALPAPAFDSVFTGYSLMEDLALSLNVAKRGWKLANVRTARIFHDSQPGEHKSDVTVSAAMALTNRHYLMTEVLRKQGFLDYVRLAIWELFQLSVTAARGQTRSSFPLMLRGKWQAARHLLLHQIKR